MKSRLPFPIIILASIIFISQSNFGIPVFLTDGPYIALSPSVSLSFAQVAVNPPAGITVPSVCNKMTFAVKWKASTTLNAHYELQEATDGEFTIGLRTAYKGLMRSTTITGRQNGVSYYYRVRATHKGSEPSDWIVGANPCQIWRQVKPPAHIMVPTKSDTGNYKVRWNPSPTLYVSYELEEATDTIFSTDLRTAYTGANTIAKITGRIGGKTYWYRVRATRRNRFPSDWAVSANGCMVPQRDFTPPANVTNFIGTPSDGQITLTWKNPADVDFAGTKILRRPDRFPISPADGLVIYDGKAEASIDTDLSEGTTYYYAAFTYDLVPNYSSGVTVAVSLGGQSGWVKVIDQAPWGGRYGMGLVAHDGKLFILGGLNDKDRDFGHVWASSDGVNWTQTSGFTYFNGLGSFAYTVYSGKIWVVGGYSWFSGSWRNEVWSSPNGAQWNRETDSLPFQPGIRKAVVYGGKMWLIGSFEATDVWWSTDGVVWTRSADNVPWAGYDAAGVWVQDGKIWVMEGRETSGRFRGSVWTSQDGTMWEPAAPYTDLPPNSFRGPMVVYHGEPVVLGGGSSPYSNEVYFSLDGHEWRRLYRTPVWDRREQQAAAVFNDRIWVLGGYFYSQNPETTIYYSDVWSYEGPLGCEGSGTGNDPPTVKLLADPATGPAPHTVVLEAEAVDPNCDRLIYQWDFGDGTTDTGMYGVLHTYENEGSYPVTLTVSDGQYVVSDSTTVTVAPVPCSETDIGGNGGSLSFGHCEVTVPPGIPTSSFTLMEMPSMADLAGQQLDPSQYVPIGATCRLDTLLKSGTPFNMKITYTDAEIPSGFSADNLAVLVRAAAIPETLRQTIHPPGAGVFSLYHLQPATVDTASHMITFDTPRGGDFQIVALSKPLETITSVLDAQAASSLAISAAEPPYVVINQTPGNIGDLAIFTSTVISAFGTAYQFYSDRGFVLPPGKMTLVIGRMAPESRCQSCDGFVFFDDPWTIYFNAAVTDYNVLTKLTAHELFHSIQWINNNSTSVNYFDKENRWFSEGTANWACDEVFDTIQGNYDATKWERLAIPLNNPQPNDSSEYQTVGFWKWVEAERPGTLQEVILRQMLSTHDSWGPFSYKENTAKVKYLDTFLSVWPPGHAEDGNLDFLQYAQDVEYWKNFDVSETGTDELWSDPPHLGQPKDCQAEPDNIIRLARGEPGESKDNKLTKSYLLTQYLSMETILVRMSDVNPISGQLHAKFLPQVDPLDAVVIVHDGKDEISAKTFRDLSELSESEAEFISRFRSDYEAVIIIVDPRWQVDWGSNMTDGEIEIWIEDPCPPNPGTVTQVSTTEELINALKTVGAGNTIKLAPNLYEPPVALWTVPGLWDRKMSLLAQSVTLDGGDTSGARIRIAGDYGGLFTYGSVVLKNLTIEDDGGLPGVGVPGIYGTQGDLTVCNVDIEGVGYGDGLYFAPWTGGSHTLKVVNSTITTTNGDNYDYADGIYLEACNAGPGGSSIDAQIKETTINGWRDGVVWFDCGFTAVSVDCAGISGNQFFNAVRWLDTSPSDTPVEYCPKQ